MKKLSKLLSLALAILMVMSLAGAAFATGPDPVTPDPPATPVQVNIKLTNAVKGAQFAFYKLCDAVKSGDAYTYTVNSTFSSDLQTMLQVSSDEAVIAKLRDYDGAQIRNFADQFYKNYLKDDLTGFVPVTAEADGDSFSANFSGDAGYYLIAQKTPGSEPTSTAYSLIMIDTGADPDNPKVIPVKMDVPVLTKKVIDVNDSRPISSPQRQDGADYDLGDEIEFYLTGSVAMNIGSYENAYKMIFHDTACAGLEYVRIAEVSVKHVRETDAATQIVNTSCYNVDKPGTCGTCTFEVSFADMKNISDKDGNPITMHGGEEVTVKVIMKLTDRAVIGQVGNENVCKLEYSNNPYVATETGKTPDDIVKVFTHKLTIHKVDDNDQKLNGAGFTLYKYKNITGTGSESDPYAWESCDAVGSENFGLASDPATFVWERLDEGTYMIKETTLPGEQYTQAPNLYFTIRATYDKNLDDSNVINYSIEVENRNEDLERIASVNPFEWNSETGEVSVTVKNIPGTALPSTGGIGTTMFYVFGSILAIGAGVLLVSKKRMGAAD